MDEIGIEIAHKHKPRRRFEDLEELHFDLVITLSPEAHHKAMELTRTSARATSNTGRPWTPRSSKAPASSGWMPTAACATQLAGDGSTTRCSPPGAAISNEGDAGTAP